MLRDCLFWSTSLPWPFSGSWGEWPQGFGKWLDQFCLPWADWPHPTQWGWPMMRRIKQLICRSFPKKQSKTVFAIPTSKWTWHPQPANMEPCRPGDKGKGMMSGAKGDFKASWGLEGWYFLWTSLKAVIDMEHMEPFWRGWWPQAA